MTCQIKTKKIKPLSVALFLSLLRGTAFRMQGIVCSLVRVLDQICVQTGGVQESQPNHIEKLGKHLCILRLQRMNPSLLRWLFRGFLVFLGLQLVPKFCVRYVRRQLGVLFENQGQLAKNSPLKINKAHNIRFSAKEITGLLLLGSWGIITIDKLLLLTPPLCPSVF